MYECVSHVTGAVLSVKAELGESDQHVRVRLTTNAAEIDCIWKGGGGGGKCFK